MSDEINDVNEAIDKLGGTTRLAEKLNVTATVVSNWRKLGFPADYYVAIQSLLIQQGCYGKPSLWRQRKLAKL